MDINIIIIDKMRFTILDLLVNGLFELSTGDNSITINRLIAQIPTIAYIETKVMYGYNKITLI